MGALNPLFLVAGAAVAVPIFLHLFQRQEARRVSFPALRYLERTEREHARRIRSRQLLLLLLRVTAVLAVVGAGAGLYLRGGGSAHSPTALVIVLDNSLSSGLVVGDTRALDSLKRVGLGTLSEASDRDRIWVIRAGEPWLPAAPGGPEEARLLVAEAQATSAPADLRAALSRAAALASASGMAAREIHLLSDLQATAFEHGPRAPARDVPVIVWSPERGAVDNRSVASVLVGGGLAPLEGERYDLTVGAGPAHDGDTAAVPVRVVLGERVEGATSLTPGTSASLTLPPAAPGWTVGFAEADPDALHADDRRYFAFRARPTPRVAVAGDPGAFFAEAVRVLEAARRLRAVSPGEADLVVSSSGEGLGADGPGSAVLVLPPSDPNLLPALNRRLAAATIPWRFDRLDGAGEVALEGAALPDALSGARVRRWYSLSLHGDPTAPPRTLALADGDPWAVEGSDATGRRYLLLASPMDPESTSLPVSSAMVRLVDWAAVSWATSGSGASEHSAGAPLAAPRDADAVQLPSGAELPLDGTRILRATGEAGIYTFLAGGRVVTREAVNPDVAESDLTPLDPGRFAEAVGPEAIPARSEEAWKRAVFQSRQGPELGGGLLLATLAALLLEAIVAATGRRTGGVSASPTAEGSRVRP